MGDTRRPADAIKRESVEVRDGLQRFDAGDIGSDIALGMRGEDTLDKRRFPKLLDELIRLLDQRRQFSGTVYVHADVAIGVVANQRFVLV